jgi:transcriptional antiterminator NusG
MTSNDTTSTIHDDAPDVDLDSASHVAIDDASAESATGTAPVDASGTGTVEAPAEGDATIDGGDGDLATGEAATADLTPASPYDLPGSWYVVHSYSGYENKVKANLNTRVKSMHLEDKVFDVVIPLEEVVEFKGGKKVNVLRKKFPGYILVRLFMDDDTWYAVRNTPGVTGFVGSGSKPTPLSRREVERILGVRKDEEEKKEPRFKPAWEVGETVRVVEGPFADFNGVIEDINVDQSKVTVLVDIFGRETPVELNFDQILKF